MPFTITIIFIVISTMLAAFIRGRSKDKCLKDFAGNQITIQRTSGKRIWGKLRVENTGLEMLYKEKHDDQSHIEASYILYKHEFADIQLLIRYHDQLSGPNKRRRQLQLKRTYHPSRSRKLIRKLKNIFKTVRDSFVEVTNLLINKAKKTATMGATISSQDKYVSKMKSELFNSVGTSYEPLLERYIGHKVVLEMIDGEKIVELPGVLKDYTAEFIEIMDVDYKEKSENETQKTDLIVPRKFALIRHLAE